MYIVLLGPPGSGKGTQGNLLSKRFNISHLSTGNLFRQILADPEHVLYPEVQIINEGKLVSDDVVNRVVENAIKDPKYSEGVIFDGYPRTVAQARALDEILNSMGKKVDVVVDLQVSQEVLLYRLLGRRVCPECKQNYHESEGYSKCPKCNVDLIQRDDDNKETIMARFEEYRKKTAPLQEYYKQSEAHYIELHVTDAEKTAEEVNKEIMEKWPK